MQSLQTALSHWWVAGIWAASAVVSMAALVADLKRRNPEIAGVMKLVWLLTVAYSGPFGLWLYWVTGRKQIRRDSLWRRGARSVAHCYSGCGIGEIVGVVITVGLLSLGNAWTAGVTFALAYVAGFTLTVMPLLAEGTGLSQALTDAVYSETASITVMEAAAIGVDLLLGGNAGLSQPLFWTSLVTSLTLGLVAAYPVNVLLIRCGIKEGMRDPRQTAR